MFSDVILYGGNALNELCKDVGCVCRRTAEYFMCDRVDHPEELVWSEADAGAGLPEGSEFDEIKC